MTTRQLRDIEERLVDRTRALAHHQRPEIPGATLEQAVTAVQERLGAEPSVEQLTAADALTGPERVAALIGPAGTGKGVVIDAVARAELAAGRDVIGVAVPGATAQRLGRDSPALEGRTVTVDSLTARADHGRPLRAGTVVILDEAGMCDTDRLHRLSTVVDRSDAKVRSSSATDANCTSSDPAGCSTSLLPRPQSRTHRRQKNHRPRRAGRVAGRSCAGSPSPPSPTTSPAGNCTSPSCAITPSKAPSASTTAPPANTTPPSRD